NRSANTCFPAKTAAWRRACVLPFRSSGGRAWRQIRPSRNAAPSIVSQYNGRDLPAVILFPCMGRAPIREEQVTFRIGAAPQALRRYARPSQTIDRIAVQVEKHVPFAPRRQQI